MKAKGKHYIEAMPGKLRQEYLGQCNDLKRRVEVLHVEEHDFYL